MKIATVLPGIRNLCIDSAPLIYAVENQAAYIARAQIILDLIRKQPI
jgi:hypothetical protein